MTCAVEKATKWEVEQFVQGAGMAPHEVEQFHKCMRHTHHYWICFFDSEIVAIWGVIKPSLLSDQGYFWLYTTPAMEGHEFLFVRRSQIVTQEMLQHYPRIVGHCLTTSRRSIRWLRWLGAKFGSPEGTLLPFVIEANNG